MRCRHCGTEIAERALICYRCGTATTAATFEPAASRRSSRGLLLVSLLGLAVSVAAAVAVQFAAASETVKMAVWAAPVAAGVRVAVVLYMRRRRSG